MLGNIARIKQGPVLIRHGLHSRQIRIGAEQQLHKCAWIVVRRFYAPIERGPPENPLELRKAAAHFRQSRAAKVEEDIRVPARDFCSPFVLWIATMRANDSDFGEAPRNLF